MGESNYREYPCALELTGYRKTPYSKERSIFQKIILLNKVKGYDDIIKITYINEKGEYLIFHLKILEVSKKIKSIVNNLLESNAERNVGSIYLEYNISTIH